MPIYLNLYRNCLLLLFVLMFLPRRAFSGDIIEEQSTDEWKLLSIKLWNKISELTNQLSRSPNPEDAAFIKERLRRLDSADCILARLEKSPQVYGLAHVLDSGPSSTKYYPGKK